MTISHSPTIAELPEKQKQKVIKIYLKAFKEAEVPCPTCTTNCCNGCAAAQGYFSPAQAGKAALKYGFIPWRPYSSFQSEEEQTKYCEGRSHGKIDHGFFRAGKGCVIPFEERSQICVGFTCGKMTNAQWRAGQAIHKELYTLRK